jgi:hypothetical protein
VRHDFIVRTRKVGHDKTVWECQQNRGGQGGKRDSGRWWVLGKVYSLGWSENETAVCLPFKSSTQYPSRPSLVFLSDFPHLQRTFLPAAHPYPTLPTHIRLSPNMRFWQAISILLASFTIANAANVSVRQRDSNELLGKRQVVQANICATVGPLSVPGLLGITPSIRIVSVSRVVIVAFMDLLG